MLFIVLTLFLIVLGYLGVGCDSGVCLVLILIFFVFFFLVGSECDSTSLGHSVHASMGSKGHVSSLQMPTGSQHMSIFTVVFLQGGSPSMLKKPSTP
eukprot:2199345-Amphidinium_carterae.1